MLDCPHRILFIRHGETDWNYEGRLQGQRDIPLNWKGREQATTVGNMLRRFASAEIDRLESRRAFYSSPLARTRETIELAREAMRLPPQAYTITNDLTELTFGDWEGLTWPEVTARDPEGAAARAADKWNYTPPNGESYATLASRLTPWVQRLTGDVFVASHGGVARALMNLLSALAPERAAEVNIFQGRALVFEQGRFAWLG